MTSGSNSHLQVIDSSWPAPGHCSGCWDPDKHDYVTWPRAVALGHAAFHEPPSDIQLDVDEAEARTLANELNSMYGTDHAHLQIARAVVRSKWLRRKMSENR